MKHSIPAELIFERSIGKTAALLAGAILMTGMSYFFITRGILRFAFDAWLLGAILGPIAIVINASSLFRSGSQVIFNEHGVNDLRTSWGLIPWTEILSFAIVPFYANRFLCIYLRDESARVARLSLWGRIMLRANHAKGFPAFKIRFMGLTPGLDEAWEYLETHHPEKVLAVPPLTTWPSAHP